MWKSLSFCSKRVLWSCYIGKILHVMLTVMPSNRCRRMNTTTTAASSATAATDTAVYPIAGLAVAEPTAASSMPSTETADAVKTKLPRPSLQHQPLRPFAWPLPIQKTHLNWWDIWHHTFSFLTTFRRATTDADRRQRQNRPCLPQTAHPERPLHPTLKACRHPNDLPPAFSTHKPMDIFSLATNGDLVGQRIIRATARIPAAALTTTTLTVLLVYACICQQCMIVYLSTFRTDVRGACKLPYWIPTPYPLLFLCVCRCVVCVCVKDTATRILWMCRQCLIVFGMSELEGEHGKRHVGWKGR